jgi:uncharacterized protein (DUF2235 family)
MPKNIVVCCDGTANELATAPTNVLKFFYTLVKNSTQLVYYQPGLGTMEAPGALSFIAKQWSRLVGKVFGAGLESNICNAYAFLINHFEPGDRIFLIGFSRGAYTVRAVAGLIYSFGLIRKENENLIIYAIRLLSALQSEKPGRISPNAFKAVDTFKENFAFATPEIWFVGVWDTVQSVGWSQNVLIPYTANNPKLRIGRHAIAIDERRAFFRPNLWRSAGTGGQTDLKQVWFPGVHCDVGGGYPEAESGLSKVPLEWMLREAASAGLLTDLARVNAVLGRADGGYVPPDPKAAMHESLTPAWWGAEFVSKRHYNWVRQKQERRLNLFRRRTIPDGSMIHDAAYQRGTDYQKLLPANAVRVS